MKVNTFRSKLQSTKESFRARQVICATDVRKHCRPLYETDKPRTTTVPQTPLRTCRSLNAAVVQLKNCPFGVKTTMELKNVTTTSKHTGTLLCRYYMSSFTLDMAVSALCFTHFSYIYFLLIPLLYLVSDVGHHSSSSLRVSTHSLTTEVLLIPIQLRMRRLHIRICVRRPSAFVQVFRGF